MLGSAMVFCAVQVSELRPLKAHSTRMAGFEAELAEKQRQVKDLQEQLAAAKARSRVAPASAASREEPRTAARAASESPQVFDAEVTHCTSLA